MRLRVSFCTGVFCGADGPQSECTNILRRDQIRENVLVKQYYLDVDIAHLISFDEEVAHKLNTEPAEIIPLVRQIGARDFFGTLADDAPSSRPQLRNAPSALFTPRKKTNNSLNTSSSFTPPSPTSLSAISQPTMCQVL